MVVHLFLTSVHVDLPFYKVPVHLLLFQQRPESDLPLNRVPHFSWLFPVQIQLLSYLWRLTTVMCVHGLAYVLFESLAIGPRHSMVDQ